MANIFKSPRGMLGQAKRHLSKLEAKINTFVRDKPWTGVVEKDIDGVTNVAKIKFTKQLSEELPHIVFDCANNLRSVLDQIAFAIGRKHIGSDPKSAKFPFGPTESDMLNNLAGGCKDLPAEIRNLFASFKPYKGGNNAIWAMNELCNVPKHKTIYPVVIGGGTLGLGGNFAVGAGGLQIQGPTWDSEKNEMIFARFPDGAIQGNPNFNVTFGVALDDVDEVIRGQHPVKVLRSMTGEVEYVLMATERECRSIGLIT
jgi:hypothetical protein